MWFRMYTKFQCSSFIIPVLYLLGWMDESVLNTDWTSGSFEFFFKMYLEVLDFHNNYVLHLIFPKQVSASNYNIILSFPVLKSGYPVFDLLVEDRNVDHPKQSKLFWLFLTLAQRKRLRGFLFRNRAAEHVYYWSPECPNTLRNSTSLYLLERMERMSGSKVTNHFGTIHFVAGGRCLGSLSVTNVKGSLFNPEHLFLKPMNHNMFQTGKSLLLSWVKSSGWSDDPGATTEMFRKNSDEIGSTVNTRFIAAAT